jgi:hypothetical protein
MSCEGLLATAWDLRGALASASLHSPSTSGVIGMQPSR